MCGKFNLAGCCPRSSSSSNSKARAARRRAGRRRQAVENDGVQEEEPNNGKYAPGKSSEELEDESYLPNVNFVEAPTIKILTEIGELKGFRHNSIDDAQIEKDLTIHGDILARLENPTQFS